MATTKIPAEFLSINAIQGTLIADNAVTTVHIAQNAITSVQIPNNSIGTVQIALNTVTSTHIAQNQITTIQLANNSVQTLNIADDQVTAAKLADAAVVTASIVDLNVTEGKIAANAITASKIPDGSITATQIGANAVTLAKMASLTRGSILIGNASADVTALGIGTSGYVLKSDGTDIAWAAEQTTTTLTTAAQPNITSLGTLTALTVDNIALDGSTATISGDLDIDASADINLDAGGGDWRLKDDGTTICTISNVSGDLQLLLGTQDKDFKFQGDDGGSQITALTLDMSDGGTAIFNHDVQIPDNGRFVAGTGSDLEILYDGSNAFIQNHSGGAIYNRARTSWYVKTNATNGGAEDAIAALQNGAVELYYDNSKKIETTTAGVSVTGKAVGTLTTDNDGSFDMNASNNFKCTPSGNFTLTFTNMSAQSGNILLINSGGHTVSAHSNTKVDANFLGTVSTAGTYLLAYFSDGTNAYMTNSAVYT